MAGRPRKPNELHIAEGTYRAAEHGSKVVAPKKSYLTKTPTAPKTLGKEGKAHWKLLAKSMIDMQLLTEADIPILTIACMQWEMVAETEGALQMLRRMSSQALPTTETEIVRAMTAASEARKYYLATLRDLGIGPVARSKNAGSGDTKRGTPGVTGRPRTA